MSRCHRAAARLGATLGLLIAAAYAVAVYHAAQWLAVHWNPFT